MQLQVGHGTVPCGIAGPGMAHGRAGRRSGPGRWSRAGPAAGGRARALRRALARDLRAPAAPRPRPRPPPLPGTGWLPPPPVFARAATPHARYCPRRGDWPPVSTSPASSGAQRGRGRPGGRGETAAEAAPSAERSR